MAVWIAVGAAVIAGAALYGPIASDVEQAKYSVVETHGNIEIRDYASQLVAEVETQGEREDAIYSGFKLVASYIFGENQGDTEVAMTAPVTQQAAGKHWKIRFVMPSEHTLSSLPKPENAAVRIRSVGAKRFAVIQFSGIAGDDSLAEYTKQLQQFIKEKKLKSQANPVHAYYNPPWTLPFLRRNEVMVEISRK